MPYLYVSKHKIDMVHATFSNNYLYRLTNFFDSIDIDFKFLKLSRKKDERKVKSSTLDRLGKISIAAKIETIRAVKLKKIFKIRFKGVYSEEFDSQALFLGETSEGDRVILFGSEDSLTYNSRAQPNSHKIGGSFVHTVRTNIIKFLLEKDIIDKFELGSSWIAGGEPEEHLIGLYNTLYDDGLAVNMEAIIQPDFVFTRTKHINSREFIYIVLASPISVSYTSNW